MNIVVLAGGLSTERDVSICTGKMVCKALKERGHNAILVDLFIGYKSDTDDWASVFEKSRESENSIDLIGTDIPDIDNLKSSMNNGARIGENVIDICRAADIVFMALHGEDGENGTVQATFDLMGIKYTGSGYFGSAIAMNKFITKQLFINNDIRTPECTVINEDTCECKLNDIKMPCVVKPCSGGSSIGVSIVNTKQELQDAIRKAAKFEDEILVEEYIKGREFSIGVLDENSLPIIEIIPKQGFYDYANKYQKGFTLEICPAELDEQTTKRMQAEAEKVHKVLGLEVYSRVDFLLDEDNNIYCLEANTLPGMTPTSLLPQEAAAVGIEYGELCEKIIELSLAQR
jgi:D-alanine-D-alanine ligase